EKDPARRWRTAREMALALEAAIRCAPASEVGPWCEALAEPALVKRAAQVRELESSSAVKIPPRTLGNPSTVPQAFPPMRQHMPSVTQAFDYSGPDEDDAPTPYHPGKSLLIHRPPPADEIAPQPMSMAPLPTAPSISVAPPSSASGAWPPAPPPQQYIGSNQSGSYSKPLVASSYDPSASLQYNPNASVIMVAPPTSTAMKILIAIATAALIFAIGAAVIAVRNARQRGTFALPPARTAAPVPLPTIQNSLAPEQPSSNPFDEVNPKATSSAPVMSAAPSVSASASAEATDKKNKPKATPSTKPRPKPAASCDPPFTRDGNGVKIYKPECL
ncbi:MAG: hypothetical protein ABI551_00165, partial [Polyangiaceae bacterium]